MTLTDFAGELRRRWKLFATIVVLCALAAALLALVVPNRYTSSIRLLITSTGSTTSSAYESLQLEAARTQSYVTLVASDVIAQRVVDDLGLSESAHDVADGVNGVISAATNIIDVTVTGDSPEQATAIADSLGRQFVQYSAAVETPVGSDDKKVVVRTLGPASPPTHERPGPLVFGLIGALIGLVLGVAAVWIRSRTDRVVRTPRDAEAATGLRVFGPVCAGAGPVARDAETYRALSVWLRSAGRPSAVGGPVWLVAGPGAVGVATELGRAIAAERHRVLLVGAGTELGSPARSMENVDVKVRGMPAEIVQDMVAAARSDYAAIVIAAAGDPADSPALAGFCDAVVLAADAGSTSRRNLSRLADDMRTVGATFAGVVLVSYPTTQSEADDTHNGGKHTSRPSTSGDRDRLLAERSNDVG